MTDPGSGRWEPAAALDVVPAGTMKGVAVGDVAVLLVNLAGEVFAYDDRCPHALTPLSFGSLDGEVLTCAAHAWTFDCRLGQGLNASGVRLRAIPVRVEAGLISVRLD